MQLEFKRLEKDFFARHTVDVAQDLIGKMFIARDMSGFIVETEAYRGQDDPCSHAFKKTPRSSLMYGPPGICYIYFIYGMHHCLNIVTEAEGEPGAVLIRSIKLLQPFELLINGPGLVCRHLAMTRAENGIDLLKDATFYVTEGPLLENSIQATSRIGIRLGKEKLWRFKTCHNGQK